MGHHFGVIGGRGIGLDKVWRGWARGKGFWATGGRKSMMLGSLVLFPSALLVPCIVLGISRFVV